MAACRNGSTTANDVDLNVAAMQAQQDIANYAAVRRAGPAAHVAAPASDPGAVAARYFALIDAHRYAPARALWGHGGEDCRRDAPGFAAALAGVTAVAAHAGTVPGGGTAEAGRRRVEVPIALHLTPRQGAQADARVTVTLRRAAPDEGVWRLTGVAAASPPSAPVRAILAACPAAG